MGFIRLLNEQLINKIAAGEVVERPSSAVKELVENCLDAGATKIHVELTDGGKKRIVVSDNGRGMDQEDALLALTRHATSKISKDEDLFNLCTMGFRGEALASIAAVSKFTLLTSTGQSDAGVRVTSDGGAEPTVTPWQSERGTTILIEDLFYNVPVRAKFLKTASTEYGNVLELMQSLALAWPQVSFTLVHNGKEQLNAPAVESRESDLGHKLSFISKPDDHVLRRRFSQIFKNEKETPMVFAEGDCAYGSSAAFVSAPGVERGTARDIYIFVNGRFVKDKNLRFALLRGYHSHLMKGKFPVAVVFLRVDPGLVDVNVHPNKTEVRLQFASELHSMIAMSVREELRKAEWTSLEKIRGDVPTSGLPRQASPSSLSVFSSPSVQTTSPAAMKPFSTRDKVPSHSFKATSSVCDAEEFADFATIRGTGPASALFEEPLTKSADYSAAPTEAAIPWDELSFMGSIADCYLLFRHGSRKNGSRLLVVDQHAFHERIVFERLCNNEDLLSRSQSLLIPEELGFSLEETDALRASQELLERNGFKISFTGESDQTKVEVHAVPALLAKADPEALLLAFTTASQVPASSEGLGHDLLSTMACHAAVRAGEVLGENELKALLNEAKSVDFFHNCPHGRRVFRWWSEEQIGRWFDR